MGLRTLPSLGPNREYKTSLLHHFLSLARRELEGKRNQITVSCVIIQAKISSLFLDLTIALSNPIKFFNLQDKRSVKLKDGSVEVSFTRFCH